MTTSKPEMPPIPQFLQRDDAAATTATAAVRPPPPPLPTPQAQQPEPVAKRRGRGKAAKPSATKSTRKAAVPPVMETPAPVMETPAPVMETPAPVMETPAPVMETKSSGSSQLTITEGIEQVALVIMHDDLEEAARFAVGLLGYDPFDVDDKTRVKIAAAYILSELQRKNLAPADKRAHNAAARFAGTFGLVDAVMRAKPVDAAEDAGE